MSDFDKEAERERLREKYEHDEQKREVTERMSELLLKGATMTNAHCEQCGDPIFRYDGQEFCATCQRAVERSTADEADDASADDADEDATSNGDTEEIEVATPGEEAVRFGGETAAAGDDRPTGQQSAAPAGDEAPRRDSGADTSVAATPTPDAPTRRATDAEAAGESLDGAEAELARSVAALARRAGASEDPGQAKVLLEAAREAAEALAALRG